MTGAASAAMSLDQLPSHQWATVLDVLRPTAAEDRELVLRLTEIGFVPGEAVRIVATGVPGPRAAGRAPGPHHLRAAPPRGLASSASRREPPTMVEATLNFQPGAAGSPTAPPARIALLGNPNCGKTALFNLLTGSRQKVANYAGVTVERKEGTLRTAGGPPRLRARPAGRLQPERAVGRRGRHARRRHRQEQARRCPTCWSA